jgi:hypothetical protein
MALPSNPEIPFFTYGLFQPGEPSHRLLQSLLASPATTDRVSGNLFVRDGLPLAVLEPHQHEIQGSVLYFSPASRLNAYELISNFEPASLYRWETTVTLENQIDVNILVARRPCRGHMEPFEGDRWSYREDPVFRHGLRVVADSLLDFGSEPFKSAPPDFFDWPRFFRLQMAYMLLWAVIERYTAFTFGPDLEPMERVRRLGELEKFQLAVSNRVSRKATVTDSRNLDAYQLDSESPKTAAKYYYQIRNNLSHRGKGAWHDGELVRNALRELLQIFEDVLDA